MKTYNFELFISLTVILFYAIKFSLCYKHRIKKDVVNLVLYSTAMVPKQTIKNSFDKSIAGYYKKSNRINMFFYVVVLLEILLQGFTELLSI